MSIYVYIFTGMLASFLLCMSFVLFYLKYRKNILQKQYQIKAAEVLHQKELLKAVINSQEEERKRIGMDLHDEVGSKLSALRLMVAHFSDKNDAEVPSLMQFNQQCKATIDGVITNVRNISHNLSPILSDGYNFYDALYDFCEDINRSGRIHIAISIQQAAEHVLLEHYTKLSLYRIITELINNTIKHAEAHNAYIDFSLIDHTYEIVYKDNGKGLPDSEKAMKKGIGFKNIESRINSVGALYTLQNHAGKGFEAHIHLPVKN